MEAFNSFSRIRFGRTGRALVTSLALLSLPAIAAAGPDTFSVDLKEYPAKRSDYKRVAKACNISPHYSKKDIVFLYAEGFLYKSAGHCLNIGEKRYCATYFVDKPEDPNCIGIFYTTGRPNLSKLFSVGYDVTLGSVVFATPIGYVEMLMTGNKYNFRELGE